MANLCLVLNINRCNTERVIRRALRCISQDNRIVIVDLNWREPLLYRGRKILRQTLGELVSHPDIVRNFKTVTNTVRKTCTEAKASFQLSISPVPSSHLVEMIIQSAAYDFFRDMDADYLFSVDQIIQRVEPDHTIIILGDANSEQIPALCAARGLKTEIIGSPRSMSLLTRAHAHLRSYLR